MVGRRVPFPGKESSAEKRIREVPCLAGRPAEGGIPLCFTPSATPMLDDLHFLKRIAL